MMNQEDIFKKIGLILNELQDQYEYLGQNPTQLHELELELFKANANFLTDHIQIVSKLNNSKALKELPQEASPEPADSLEKEVLFVPQEEVKLNLGNYAPVVTEIKEEIQEKVNEVSLPEETVVPVFEKEKESQENIIEEAPEIEKPAAVSPIDQELFKPDNAPSTFEFILNDHSFSDKFEFEEKSVDDIFDRPLSTEELRIIEQKQKLKEQQSQQYTEPEEEDEIGPEPFLVAKEEDVVPAASNELEIDPQAPVVGNYHAKHEEPVKYAEPVRNIETVKHEEPAKLTLNERLASQLGAKAVSQENAPKGQISDLKQGINLNDKMLYIKDLFNGYNLAYAEVIDLINKMPDFNTADSFLQGNYAVKNNWASKQATVDKFYEVLQQRFRD